MAPHPPRHATVGGASVHGQPVAASHSRRGVTHPPAACVVVFCACNPRVRGLSVGRPCDAPTPSFGGHVPPAEDPCGWMDLPSTPRGPRPCFKWKSA